MLPRRVSLSLSLYIYIYILYYYSSPSSSCPLLLLIIVILPLLVILGLVPAALVLVGFLLPPLLLLLLLLGLGAREGNPDTRARARRVPSGSRRETKTKVGNTLNHTAQEKTPPPPPCIVGLQKPRKPRDTTEQMICSPSRALSPPLPTSLRKATM